MTHHRRFRPCRRVRLPGGLTALLALTLLLALAPAAAQAATFTVNATDDVTDGTCDGTHCSLREAIEAARAWAAGSLPMMEARALGGHAMGAARPLAGAARFAAYAAGQAACVGHVAEHDLGAAAYAIKAAKAAAPHDPDAARAERDWQREQLPDAVRGLVLEDQARRNSICWGLFLD